jgi:exosortase
VGAGQTIDLVAMLRQNWISVVALLAVVLPALFNVARETWSTEAGAHGPIVLATGLWLLHHSLPEMLERRTPPPPLWLTALLMVPVVVMYVLGRALDLLVFEALAALLMSFILVLMHGGFGVFRARPFPFLYLALLVPVPGWVLDAATIGLQHFISTAATAILALLDYPVMRQGVVIYVAHYQLLVEDACSGMNSLFGLIAISLFYIYLLHRANWRHALMLIIAILPIAIFVNLIRVLTLILITYYFGDAVAQGFIHNFAGILLFAFSLGMMVLVDMGIRRFAPGNTEAAA